jgi:hypothetical protein
MSFYLGKLAAHGHGVGGYCLDCAATYREDLLKKVGELR